MACTSPVVVRACGIGWIIADERTLLSNFCTKQTIDGCYPVTFASLLTSSMSLRPFSWLYLCLHWVVRGIYPTIVLRGRGGSRCRAQFTYFKYYHIHPVQKTAIFELNRRIFMKLCMCTYLADVWLMFCWSNMILLLGGKLWANDRVFHPFSVFFRCDICSMWIQLADTLHARHKWCQVFACQKWLGSWY